MRSVLQLGLSLALLGAAFIARAQSFTIIEGSGVGCDGAIYDSGGLGGAGYSELEDFTFTICPLEPGNAIALSFVLFDLDETGPAPVDQLEVFDGDTDAAPSLGVFTGTAAQSLVLTSSMQDTTGCLTLRFRSNSAGTGVFAMSYSCIGPPPCEHPTAAAIMSEASPAHVCVGETLTFDASLSTAAPGHTLSGYFWRFGQGAPETNGTPTYARVFNEPGIYAVQLEVVDEVGCASVNDVDLTVLVPTEPHIELFMSDTVACIGHSFAIGAMAEGTPWSATEVVHEDGLFLPDDVGLPTASDMELVGFPPGSVLEAGDLEMICVEMEHSYMGDPVLRVTCPNGQIVILHQQGGGPTYIGGANDTDNNTDPVLGQCWSYCWSDTATNGTWVDNSVFGTNNTTEAGVPPNPALNPGTYEPLQPLSNLVGCPLNGTWEFSSTDLWGADQGFLCSWSLQFSSSSGFDPAGFAPTIGAACDSSFWTAPDVIWTDADCDSIVVAPSVPGSIELAYTVIDDHGCTHDTLVNVAVLAQDDPYCLGLFSEDPMAPVVPLVHRNADGQLIINARSTLVGVMLTDAAGRVLMTRTIRNGATTTALDTRILAKGLYVVSVEETAGRSATRFVVE